VLGFLIPFMNVGLLLYLLLAPTTNERVFDARKPPTSRATLSEMRSGITGWKQKFAPDVAQLS